MKFLPDPQNIDKSLGFLLLRFWLGMRALVTGIEKYTAKVQVAKPVLDDMGMETGAEVMVQTKVYGFEHYHALPQVFANKFADEPVMQLFSFVYDPFCKSLGVVLIVLGLTTLLGIAMRTTLFLQGILYVGLTFGFVLLAVDEGIAQLGVHTLMCAIALAWVKYNCFTLTTKY